MLAFASPNVAFIHGFALVVTIVLTIVDTWAPHAASGGHHHKVWLYAAIMLLISGLALMVVPWMVQGLFQSVAGDTGFTGGTNSYELAGRTRWRLSSRRTANSWETRRGFGYPRRRDHRKANAWHPKCRSTRSTKTMRISGS